MTEDTTGTHDLGPATIVQPSQPQEVKAVFPNKATSSAKLKNFLSLVVKIAVGITLAVVVLALLGWLVVAIDQQRHEAAEAPLGIPKTWPTLTIIGKSQGSLRTVWRGGMLFYQFDLEHYSPLIARAKRQANQAALIFTFLDKDGFKLFDHRLPLSETIDNLGADNRPSGLSWKGEELVTEELYGKAAKWELLWAGFPDPSADTIPPPPIALPEYSPVRVPRSKPVDKPKWREMHNWRSLREGMSEDAVRLLLGEPGKIATYGSAGKTWFYAHAGGGQVDFDSSGKVNRWTEP